VAPQVPAPNFHILTRVMQDRRLTNGVGLYATGARFPEADTRTIAGHTISRSKSASELFSGSVRRLIIASVIPDQVRGPGAPSG
jgi:hypothetical protein